MGVCGYPGEKIWEMLDFPLVQMYGELVEL